MLDLSAIAAVLLSALLVVLTFRWLLQTKTQNPATVLRLWYKNLPEISSAAYEQIVAQMNSNFAMFSVALNDAFSAHKQEERLAFPLLAMSVTLLGRFQNGLEALTKLLQEFSRTLRKLPDVEPLAAADFHSPAAVSLARRLALVHTLLLSSRMRFPQKLADIERVVRRLAEDYQAAVLDVFAGDRAATRAWETLDAGQYDLNSLWQEMQILFKAILHHLPDDAAAVLPARFEGELARREAAARPVPRIPRARVR